MDTNFRAKTVGVIDVGSNTIKLLIARRGEKGLPQKIDFIVEETRIGEGMNGNPPTIDRDAIERGSTAIARLAKAASSCDVLAIVATSAVRDAANGQEFADAVEKACGHRLRVLTGDEEASYIGEGLRCDPSLAHLESYSLIDLGGGSLECIQFSNGHVLRDQSLRLGAVRLASLLVEDRSSPLSPEDESRIRNYVLRSWRDSEFESGSSPSRNAVVTGGTANIISDAISPEQRIGGLALDDFAVLKKTVCAATETGRIEQHKIPKSRADIFPTALVTIETSLGYLGCDRIFLSSFNLRYGVAAMFLEGACTRSGAGNGE